jgi:hypothetical protein
MFIRHSHNGANVLASGHTVPASGIESRRHLKITLAAAVAAVSLAAPALADEAEFERYARNQFQRLFDAPNGSACFSRAYEQAHLDAHPKQNVATVQMLADDVHPGNGIALRLLFVFRKPKIERRGVALCESQPDGSGLKCYVIGMGGEVDVSVETSGAALLSAPKPLTLWKPGHNANDPEPSAPFGNDDKLFRLERQSDETCATLAGDPVD